MQDSARWISRRRKATRVNAERKFEVVQFDPDFLLKFSKLVANQLPCVSLDYTSDSGV